ncbi:NAD(P)-dependent alcohol dehydrogenase [Paenibacillus alba]|uniref:zinc-dependent alcohol dehydrogenase family protein n=1 Tax=Paenibacillus alba TaxID=1197127 RepID=UPI001567791C|nr:NAD(P)-dependent alcohol dehydrogenase [Paenibacillus alba]NQX69264.1 NAD(P)-dependent alcohol dehydrogenase [Paenibacillus alba]
MKVIQIQGGYGLAHVKQVEREMPIPGPNEVLIKIRAVALNSRDLGVIAGIYQPDLSNPLVLTSDAVGEVVALGAQASKFGVGERVSGIFTQSWIAGEASQANWGSTLGSPLDGMLAEYVVLPEQGLVQVPDYLTDAEAATLPCAGVTAWHAIVEEGGVKSGDTVVVQGTGGVSLFALQFAKLQGASVIATSSSDEKLEKARQLGADFGINYRAQPEWENEVLKLTGGRGADHIVDVGGASTLNHSISALRVGGRISIVGLLSGGSVEGFQVVPAIVRKVRLQAINVGSRAMFEAMNRAITQHTLHPAIDRVFSFEQAIEAFDYLQNGSYFGKICITL